jgi:UDP-glucuronate decarboxylase
MRYLVTGGAGFIGSSLCRRLLNDRHSVACLDDLSTGKYSNIKELEDNPKFEFFNHDLTKAFFPENVDAIFNLACPASPVHYQYNPIRTLKMGTLAMYNVLGMAARLDIPILQASTSEIYGDPSEHPQKESYLGNVNPIGPRACYDEGKRVAEALCVAYESYNGVQIHIARIFNTYGPYMDPKDGRVVSNFIIQALSDEPITVYGDGSQTRSFCYVDDLVEGLIRLMQSNFHKPINLGNPKEFTILKFANLVKGKTKSSSEIVHKKLPEDDPRQRCPDISLANETLKWNPKVPLDEGLDETIEWFRSIRNPEENS